MTPYGADHAQIDPIAPLRRWEVLSQAELDRLREAVFTVLAEVGVRFPLSPALDILEAHGAAVDRAQRGRAPAAGAGRDGPGRGAARVCALRPRRRPATCRSTAASATCPTTPAACSWSIRVAASGGPRRWPTWPPRRASSTRCPQVAFYWGPIVAAGDTPVGSRALHEAAAVLANTDQALSGGDLRRRGAGPAACRDGRAPSPAAPTSCAAGRWSASSPARSIRWATTP